MFIDICGHLLNFGKITFIRFFSDEIIIEFGHPDSCFIIGIDNKINEELNNDKFRYDLLVNKEDLEKIEKNLRSKALENIHN